MEAAQGDESHGEAERQNESESDLGRTKHGEWQTDGESTSDLGRANRTAGFGQELVQKKGETVVNLFFLHGFCKIFKTLCHDILVRLQLGSANWFFRTVSGGRRPQTLQTLQTRSTPLRNRPRNRRRQQKHLLRAEQKKSLKRWQWHGLASMAIAEAKPRKCLEDLGRSWKWKLHLADAFGSWSCNGTMIYTHFHT